MKREAPKSHMPSLITALLIAMLPHFVDLPAWIILWVLCAWSYCYVAVKYKLPLPGKVVRSALTVLGVAFVLSGSGIRLDGTAYVGVMCIMAGLKPLEIETHRDRMITVFLAYVIIITGLFKSESLTVTLYMFVSVLVTTAVLVRINYPVKAFRETMKLSGTIMLQALPVMLILFLLFPRVHSGFWGMSPSSVGKSGFTDRLSPGDVSRIVLDDSVAFRIFFEDEIPSYDRRYFRGIVFWKFDGESWTRGVSAPLNMRPVGGDNKVNYRITIEPHHQKWLFALDLPLKAPRRAFMQADQVIRSRRTVREKLTYELSSYLDFHTGELQRWEKSALKGQAEGNPKAQELALQWAGAQTEPGKIIESALQFFVAEGFEYTLNPPEMRDEPIDTFLFETRKGYCEHYASAFAFLMRSAGIPSRLVGGYLGGETNPYSDYLIVRQSDAHVWVEVWLEKTGWTRIDPTAVVAPERIRRGIENVLSPDEVPGFLQKGRFGFASNYINDFLMWWDAVSTSWDMWFSAYSFDAQKELLKKIGVDIDSVKGLAGVLAAALSACLVLGLLIATALVMRSRRKKDPVKAAYLVFCQKLENVGLGRRPSQGPADYARMLAAARDDLKPWAAAVTESYIRLRYAETADKDSVKQFKKLVNEFKP